MPNAAALSTALLVAFRNADVTDAERTAVLIAMAEHLPQEPAEMAARLLHHRAEATAAQSELQGIAESRRPSA